jgi:hypothetical protein
MEKVMNLKMIKEPKDLSRTVVHGKGSKVPPLFMGKGNINYQCGKCRVALAKKIWKLSLSNIIIQCPQCQSYNETAIFSLSDYPRILTPVIYSRGNLYLSKPVFLKSGIVNIGNDT